jgi:ribosomal protein S18 acetylase RimI-like enzyme
MKIEYRRAIESDIERCIDIRGLTSDNSISKNELETIGVTSESWAPLIENGSLIGNVASYDATVIGFCFGNASNGEILVLAILSGFEGKGIGRNLLSNTSSELFLKGHSEVWLAASPTPEVRAYGFYRRVGWRPTNIFEENGDEILRFKEI